ncbi:MAG: hypothetical protein ACKO0Z_25960 [Betaproteobacteria bacterium]
MRLLPKPIFIPPWIYRFMAENSTGMQVVLDLGKLLEVFTPVDAACVYAFNDYAISKIGRAGKIDGYSNPLDDFWAESVEFNTVIKPSIPHAQARIKSFTDSSTEYRDLDGHYNPKHIVSRLVVHNHDEYRGVIYMIPLRGDLFSNFTFVKEVSNKFLRDFVQYNGVSDVTKTGIYWANFIYGS